MNSRLQIKEKNQTNTISKTVELASEQTQQSSSNKLTSSIAFSKVCNYLPEEKLQELLYIDLAFTCNKITKYPFPKIWDRPQHKNCVLLHETRPSQVAELLQTLWNRSERIASNEATQTIAYKFFVTGQEITRYIASERRVSVQFKNLAYRFADQAILFAKAMGRSTIL